MESTFIEIVNPRKSSIIVGVIYRHPSMDLTGFNPIKAGLLRAFRCWGDQMIHAVYLLIDKCYLLEIWQKDSTL